MSDDETHVFECDTTAAGTGAPPSPPEFPVGDGDPAGDRLVRFIVRIDSTEGWLWLPPSMHAEPYRLARVRSASGVRFDGDGVIFRSKGEEATLEAGGRMFGPCFRNHYLSVWEHAKLNGVDFRAVGNEPGWLLDIHEGERFELDWRYGERSAVLPWSEPEVDGEGRAAVYRTESDEHALEVTIKGGGCTDSMSGVSFEASVTIRIDGSTYTGCGRALH